MNFWKCPTPKMVGMTNSKFKKVEKLLIGLRKMTPIVHDPTIFRHRKIQRSEMGQKHRRAFLLLFYGYGRLRSLQKILELSEK